MLSRITKLGLTAAMLVATATGVSVVAAPAPASAQASEMSEFCNEMLTLVQIYLSQGDVATAQALVENMQESGCFDEE